MIVWENTLAGQWLHDFAYQMILLTGFAVALINLNPLIKLDGYYFFTEWIEIPDLKERSTAFLSGWFQSRVLRLPVETPIVARRRAPFFVAYAVASGIYSYGLLFFVVRFTYNVTSHWLAEFALLPAGALFFVIFRSRLLTLHRVTREWWQHTFGAGVRWRWRHVLAAMAIAILLFVPIWRDRISAYYVIEPEHTEILHSAIPGRVTEVLVREGEHVHAGQPLLRMTSLTAEAMRTAAAAQTSGARFTAYQAEIAGRSIGPAAAEQSGAQRNAGLASEAVRSLLVAAPANGVILTQDPNLLLDKDVGTGESLIEMAISDARVARVFIPASALDRILPHAQVALALPDSFSVLRLSLSPVAGDPVPLPSGLVAKQDYKGIEMAMYYSARMMLPAASANSPYGVSGQAKIFGRRRSFAGRGVLVLMNLIKAHVW